MKSSFVLATVLAGTTAFISACGGPVTNTAPNVNKPSTPISTPVAATPLSPASSPATSPSLDPKASPAKPGASPEVKKAGAPEVKPTTAASPKKP